MTHRNAFCRVLVPYFFMYERSGRYLPHLAFLWPALAAASASEIAGSFAQQIIGLSSATDGAPAREPEWATPNTVALELASMRLRDFSTARRGMPTLVCAPYALHGAGVVDLAPGHSLVQALRASGLSHLFVTHWRSAEPAMRLLAIDDYLAALNVAVDHLGGRADLIGLCQGGWLSLMYAARFPSKVRKLVLVGAPIDIAAAPSGLSAIVDNTPLSLFRDLVRLGEGRVLGQAVQRFWTPETVTDEIVRQVLQTLEPAGGEAFAALAEHYRAWNDFTVDLPGTYYLEVIEKLYKGNELATSQFIALGQRIDLAALRAPLYLLAARDDELIAPEQLLTTRHLVGTPAHDIHTDTVEGCHLGLFLGAHNLTTVWPRIAHWLATAPRAVASVRRH